MSASVEQLCKNLENLIIGDIDGSNVIDLGDAILSLKITTDILVQIQKDCLTGIDVKQDRKIGMEDVIYILQKLADLR